MSNIAAHYAKRSAGEADDDIALLIKDALKAQLNKEADEVDASTLSSAGADEFHIGGAAATAHVLDKLDITDGDRVMDFGSGIGGPARQVATRYPACDVIGVDLTPKFVRAGAAINGFKTIADQLGSRVKLYEGDCCALDRNVFPDASVDKAFSIHVAMNIQDKAAMAKEVARVLKPGGRFIVFDQMANPQPPSDRGLFSSCCAAREAHAATEEGNGVDINTSLPYPQPWAYSQDESFCETPEVYISAFQTAGMTLVGSEDRTSDMLAVFGKMQRAMMYHFVTNMTTTPAALGPAILMGPDLVTKVGNYKKAVASGKLVLTEMVFEK